MKTNQSIELAKDVLTVGISLGTMLIVGNVVGATMPTGIGFLKKGLIGIGSTAIAGMISEQASESCSRRIDNVIKSIKAMMDNIESEANGNEEEK